MEPSTTTDEQLYESATFSGLLELVEEHRLVEQTQRIQWMDSTDSTDSTRSSASVILQETHSQSALSQVEGMDTNYGCYYDGMLADAVCETDAASGSHAFVRSMFEQSQHSHPQQPQLEQLHEYYFHSYEHSTVTFLAEDRLDRRRKTKRDETEEPQETNKFRRVISDDSNNMVIGRCDCDTTWDPNEATVRTAECPTHQDSLSYVLSTAALSSTISKTPCPHRSLPCTECIAQHWPTPLGKLDQLLNNPKAWLSMGFRLPLPPTARDAIQGGYPYPCFPVDCLPRLSLTPRQSLFHEFLRYETDPLRIQLGHYVIEFCIRSIPDVYLRPTTMTPDPEIVTDFVSQIIEAVKIFGEHANQREFIGERETIPNDIHRGYIDLWLEQNLSVSNLLAHLHHRSRRNDACASSFQHKKRKKALLFSHEELNAIGVPPMLHFSNLGEALARRGLLVQAPSSGQSYHAPICMPGSCFSEVQPRLLFNLILSGRGDTRLASVSLPWGARGRLKINHTLLAIPQFVVEGLGFRIPIIPKICAVLIEEPSASFGVEILLLYNGCNKKVKEKKATKRVVDEQHQRYSPPLQPRPVQQRASTKSKRRSTAEAINDLPTAEESLGGARCCGLSPSADTV